MPLCPLPRCHRPSHGPLTAVLIRSVADLSPVAEELIPAGQPSGRRCNSPLSHLWSPPDGASVRLHPLLQLYGSRCTQLPLIEKHIQWLSGPSSSLSVAADRPRVTRPDSNDVQT
ncbi:MAG: hypothetical protein ACK56I_20160, partial [bacterium]